MPRIVNETTTSTTLADADFLLSDNSTSGSAKISGASLKAQFEVVARKGVANGYASLDANGLVTAAQLQPAFTIEEVADATARDALTITSGEVGKRLVRLTSTGVIYLANATGSGSTKWTTFNSVAASTTSALGVIQTATDAEAIAGTNTSKAIVPSTLRAGTNQQHASAQGADYLYSDGATTSRRIETVYGAVGAVAGSDLTEVDYVFDVPTSNPTQTIVVFAWTSDNTSNPTGVAGSLACFIGAGGANLYIQQRGATASDRRYLDYPTFRSVYSGRRVRLTVAFSGNSTTSPTVTIDGVDITSAFTLTTAGTVPNWLDATSFIGTYYVRGFLWPVGYFRPGRPVNRKYAQADVDFVQMTGRLPYGDASGGSMVAAYTSDFSAGSNSWATDTAMAVAGNTDTAADGVGVPPSNDWLKISRTSGSGGLYTYRSGTIGLQRRHRFTGSIFLPVGSPVTHVQIGMSSGSVAAGTTALVALTAGSTTTFDVQFASSSTAALIGACDGSAAAVSLPSGTAIYAKGLVLYTLGALSDPIIQPALVLDDATPNNRASLLVGFTPITTRKDWRIPAFVDMSSTGNKQLLSGALMIDPTKHAIDTIETTCAGTPTFSIGDGTTATKYTGSVAHSAGRLRETVSANFPADSAKTGIYANVTASHASSTAELVIVRGHRE